VRSGGHSVAGHSTIDGGLVIDVRDLDSIEVDPGSRTARVGSGATASAYTAATGEYGLGTGFGDTGSVGVGGITLGGGVGFLLRKHGMTIDSLLAAQVVTADGRVVDGDADHEPDLFWAIRGGGGNFGVATRFELALHPVDPFVGGMLILPATKDAVAGFVELSDSASDELSTIVNVMSAPPMPFLPESVVGKTIVMGMIAWCGDEAEGLTQMDRFRDLGETLFDTLTSMPYSGMFPEEPEDYSPTAVARTGFSDAVTADDVSTSLDEIESSDAVLRAVQVRALGGAMARIPNDATPFAHRERRFMVNVAAFYTTEEERPRRQAWVDQLADALTGGDPRGYAGFLGDERPDRVRAAYPGTTWDRLRDIKATYDPNNVFRGNQNVPPA
jgi:FAD/FMN-containing dehydrogenase